jgi:hypothetical protein
MFRVVVNCHIGATKQRGQNHRGMLFQSGLFHQYNFRVRVEPDAALRILAGIGNLTGIRDCTFTYRFLDICGGSRTLEIESDSVISLQSAFVFLQL